MADKTNWRARPVLEGPPLDEGNVSVYKSCTMRLAFVAIDRPDIGYVSKELCRAVARPTQHAWEHLKHAARYLQHRPRLRWVYASQRPPAVVDAYSGSDSAGCRTSRRSTSGTVVRVGLHTISCSSSIQGTIALSSTESEFYAAVRSACRGLGVKQLAAVLGTVLGLRVHTDSSGALVLASRRGPAGSATSRPRPCGCKRLCPQTCWTCAGSGVS